MNFEFEQDVKEYINKNKRKKQRQIARMLRLFVVVSVLNFFLLFVPKYETTWQEKVAMATALIALFCALLSMVYQNENSKIDPNSWAFEYVTELDIRYQYTMLWSINNGLSFDAFAQYYYVVLGKRIHTLADVNVGYVEYKLSQKEAVYEALLDEFPKNKLVGMVRQDIVSIKKWYNQLCLHQRTEISQKRRDTVYENNSH